MLHPHIFRGGCRPSDFIGRRYRVIGMACRGVASALQGASETSSSASAGISRSESACLPMGPDRAAAPRPKISAVSRRTPIVRVEWRARAMAATSCEPLRSCRGKTIGQAGVVGARDTPGSIDPPERLLPRPREPCHSTRPGGPSCCTLRRKFRGGRAPLISQIGNPRITNH